MNIRVIPFRDEIHSLNNYSYLVLDEIGKEALLVDPVGPVELIEQKLIQYGASLTKILITHSHHDHVRLVDILINKFDILVIMSKIEAYYYGFHCPNLVLLENFTPLSFGKEHIVPLLTPGHTKGSVCYLIGNYLFSGDTLFIEGCGNCWGEGADPNDMFDSLQFLKKRIPLHTKVYPGHSYGEKPGRLFKYLLGNNIYLQIDSRHHFISFRMRNSQRPRAEVNPSGRQGVSG